jgi:hypothetical protein
MKKKKIHLEKLMYHIVIIKLISHVLIISFIKIFYLKKERNKMRYYI